MHKQTFFVSPALMLALAVSAAALLATVRTASPQETDSPNPFDDYPQAAADHLRHIFHDGQQRYSFRDDFPGGFTGWQAAARPVLRRLLGLEKIAAQCAGHEPKVELGEAEDCGSFTRRRGTIETEPDVAIPFWLLRPMGEGPFPLGVFPHGHDARGHDTTAGVFHDDKHRERSLAEDRDVAVQAAERGILAIAPATRGIGSAVVPDLNDRHGGRECRAQAIHCLLAGRTPLGERVWDMQRLLDWALRRDDVDGGRVLMMGNSGGGMVTLYAAACDERIAVAVPSCSFSTLTSPGGYVFHCDCNVVPGILEFGELYDVAGLTAPRYLLAVSGRHDSLHSAESIERSAAHVSAIYKAAGHPERFEHRWGEAGHRFYGKLMWPFVETAFGLPVEDAAGDETAPEPDARKQAGGDFNVYVSVSGENRIARYRLDGKTGKLTAQQGVDLPGAPGAQTASRDGRLLYVAVRGPGRVATLKIDGRSGGLTLLGTAPVLGNPTYLSLDRTGKYLLTAYYQDGKAAVYRIRDDGTVGAETDSVTTKKNPHSILIDRENRVVYVPNTGADVIKQYRFNAEKGTLAPPGTPEVATAAGDGPRHIWFHPKLPVVYFVNEKGSSVTAYRRDDSGSLTAMQSLSTLPDDFSGRNTCADLELSPSGDFLYASNRGHDSIAGFRVDEKDGRLTAIGRFATEATPRSFNISPDGRYVVAAGQGSGRLAVYRRDSATGRLDRLETYEVGKSPAWVQIQP